MAGGWPGFPSPATPKRVFSQASEKTATVSQTTKGKAALTISVSYSLRSALSGQYPARYTYEICAHHSMIAEFAEGSLTRVTLRLAL